MLLQCSVTVTEVLRRYRITDCIWSILTRRLSPDLSFGHFLVSWDADVTVGFFNRFRREWLFPFHRLTLGRILTQCKEAG